MNEREAKARERKALKAKKLQEDPLLNEALDRMEQHMFRRWQDPQGSAEEREQLFQLMQLSKTFRETLTAFIADGDKAQLVLTGKPNGKTGHPAQL